MKSACNALLASAVLSAFVLQFPEGVSAQTRERTVYNFCTQTGCEDGAAPQAGLIDVNGIFYGTTSGGTLTRGTVFSLDPNTGGMSVLYVFDMEHGQFPVADLINVNGILYGTTKYGGNGPPNCEGSSCGTVFSLDPSSGAETVLHSFDGDTDGAMPEAGLVDVNGTLYGTTYAGGANGYGIVFSLDPNTGAETILYSFCNQLYCPDGASPQANLIEVHGILYGTTLGGGHNSNGIAFALDPVTGAETVLHTFGDRRDGAAPLAGLIDVKGLLYGTTENGGKYGFGTVFSLDPTTDAEKVTYSFCSVTGCPDGSYPAAGLTEVRGVLYGTTSNGGTYNNGTVFSLDPETGTEMVLYSFCSRSDKRRNCLDGYDPVADLVIRKGRLYGTTSFGGHGGGGVVFAVRIP
jgi:uncharacterized repeat protein (TIGR03803 family)